MPLIKKKSLTVYVLYCVSVCLYAGNGNYPIGARSSALSNASVTLSDAWSSFNNQAGLAMLTAPMVGFHFENRFLVKELSLQAGTFIFPFKPGTVSVCYRYFGYSRYYEAKFGLAYSRKFSEFLSVGVQIDYLQTHLAEGYGNYNAVTAEMGLLAEPAKNLVIGFHLYNPARVKKNAPLEEKIPAVVRFGVGYRFDDRATLLIETEKDVDEKPVYKVGIEVKTIDKLYFRGGFSSGYEQYSFGLGYTFKKLGIDMAFTRHYYLGFSPHVSLSYQFK